MFDFPFDEPTLLTSFYCLFFYCYILLKHYYTGLTKIRNYIISNKVKNLTLFIIFFFITTHCARGDFFHFMHNVHDYSFIPNAYNYGEEIYVDIAKLFNKNYLLLRCLVWGGAYLLFVLTAKRLNVDKYLVSIFFILSYVYFFSYARASAAMAIYFLGVSFWIVPIKFKILSYLIGAFLIYSCQLFHSSAAILIAVTLSIFLPFKKWVLFLIAIVFILASSLLKDYFLFFAVSDGLNESISRRIVTYSESEVSSGIAISIINLFKYPAFYSPFFISMWAIFQNKDNKSIPKHIILCFKLVVGLMLISTTFLMFGSSFQVFYYRILFMCMIPISIVVVYLNTNGFFNKKQFLFCFIFGIFFHFLKYLYDLYLIFIDQSQV